MRVYHFVNQEYGLENIRRKRLKIATINELNDPFELFSIELSDPSVRKSFRKMKNDLAMKQGLLCFSKSWSNPVQWSHYANNHQGICLGFDVPDAFLCNVNYSRKRLLADIEALKSPRSLLTEEEIKKLFFHKVRSLEI